MPRDHVQAFQRAARAWLANEASKQGRPTDITNITREEWPDRHAEAVAVLRRRNGKQPAIWQVSQELGIGASTYHDYQSKWGKQPR